nr:MAG TPA: hypothetical protein [Caudoviricetes sp.]
MALIKWYYDSVSKRLIDSYLYFSVLGKVFIVDFPLRF